jgi:tetratricopeptide TPR_4
VAVKPDYLVPLGAQLFSLLVNVAVVVNAPTAVGVAGLLTGGSDAWERLRSLKASESEQDRIARKIAKRIKLRLDREIPREQKNALPGVATEVTVLLEHIKEDGIIILEAVRRPDGFRDYLQKQATKYRKNVPELAEPVFDELLDIVSEEFVAMAPATRQFKAIAFTSLLDGVDDIKNGVDVLHGDLEKIGSQQIEHGNVLGRIESHVAYMAAREQSTAPTELIRCGSIPEEAPGFVERTEYVSLCEILDDGGSAVLTALSGMRGVGKSQIAAAYARRCEKDGWPLVAWIHADPARDIGKGVVGGVVTGLADLASVMDVSAVEKTPEVLARMVVNTLNSSPPANRLIVFDNLESVDDLRGLRPRGQGIRVLVTTNLQNSNLGTSIPVGTFTREQSIAYLMGRLPNWKKQDAMELADVLGDLPVALAQAASMVFSDGYSMAEYRQILEDMVLDQVVRREDGDPYPEFVGAALHLAYVSALKWISDQQDISVVEAARRQLAALAFLSESGVPTSWLRQIFPDDRHHRAGRRALDCLKKRSVVASTQDGDITFLHRLQAQVIREDMRAGCGWDPNTVAEGALKLLKSRVKMEEKKLSGLDDANYVGEEWNE